MTHNVFAAIQTNLKHHAERALLTAVLLTILGKAYCLEDSG